MKYQVIGWLDLVLGLAGSIQQAIMLFLVYPKLNYLYEDFGGELPLSTKIFPYKTAVVMVLLGGCAYIGGKLVFGKVGNKKLYKLGWMTLVAMVLLGGFFVADSVRTLIAPLYRITSEL